MRVRALAFCAAALLAGAASCRSHKTKYVPQDVAEVLGVQASAIQAAIVARIDSRQPPSWVAPENW
jgi:hypothetical protein